MFVTSHRGIHYSVCIKANAIPSAPSIDTPARRPALPALHRAITDWFAADARDLPWRHRDCTPWGILVSEVMLQQTPVVRVLPVWQDWMSRWPSPSALAAEPAGEALRHWGRMGYPRRALRLHAAAVAISEDHNGHVPADYEQLLSLPGVGSYTAAAVAAFAYGRRQTVVDTNIRRVHARLFTGTALPAQALTAAETRLAAELLPDDESLSVRWNAAVMELGAVVCTARSPRCGDCPVRINCAWRLAGKPPPSYVPKGQAWHGTDRQVRGAVMAVLRLAESPVTPELFRMAPADLDVPEPATAPVDISVPLGALHRLNAPPEQMDRALAGLLADGLAELSDAGYRLPS